MRKIIQFFRDVRAEMSKVIWPSRYNTIRYTATVIGFSLVMAAILGAADFGLLKGMEALLKDRPETEQSAPAEASQETPPAEQPATEATTPAPEASTSQPTQ